MNKSPIPTGCLATGQDCPKCQELVLKNTQLLTGAHWHLGIELPIRYHWCRQGPTAICGADLVGAQLGC
jgi:hypothetical protein